MNLQQLLIRYGLIAVFIGSAAEGDVSLILSGVVAHLGIFTFPLAVAVGALGSMAGDLVWYGIGRSRGARFRAGRFYRRFGPTVERRAKRLGPWQLVAARFVFGTKGASMIFWGLHGLSLRRFVLIDAVGCVLGSLVFTSLGYALSGSAKALLGHVRQVELWLLGAVILGVLIVFIVDRTAKHELHLDQDGEADGQTGGKAGKRS
jgi:membrane protein DedA with SNARE-associated domain